MKKIIFSLVLALSSLSLSSCVSYNQEDLNLSLAISQKYSIPGNKKSINLTIVDSRSDKNLLGQKRLGEDLIKIKSNQEITEVIYSKISRDLEQNEFSVANENSNVGNKYLEIKILTLNYSAYRDFFTGSSKIDILLKVTAKNKHNEESFSTTQSLTLDKKHFIMPLITTDEKTINSALQDVLDGVSSNHKLMEFLRK